MPRSWIDNAAAFLGWRYVTDNPDALENLLEEQSAAAHSAAADHAAKAARKNTDVLTVQPGVLDVRGNVLDDLAFLEGPLAGTRCQNLSSELIEQLEAAITDGREVAVHLAAAARVTSTSPQQPPSPVAQPVCHESPGGCDAPRSGLN